MGSSLTAAPFPALALLGGLQAPGLPCCQLDSRSRIGDRRPATSTIIALRRHRVAQCRRWYRVWQSLPCVAKPARFWTSAVRRVPPLTSHAGGPDDITLPDEEARTWPCLWPCPGAFSRGRQSYRDSQGPAPAVPGPALTVMHAAMPAPSIDSPTALGPSARGSPGSEAIEDVASLRCSVSLGPAVGAITASGAGSSSWSSCSLASSRQLGPFSVLPPRPRPLAPGGGAPSALIHPWCGAKYHRAESAMVGTGPTTYPTACTCTGTCAGLHALGLIMLLLLWPLLKLGPRRW